MTDQKNIPIEALSAYVSDSRTITPQQVHEITGFIVSQTLPGIRLERIESEDPDWIKGNVVHWKLKSFTRKKISKGEFTGHIGWKSSDEALICIEYATRGWNVDYSLIQTPFFSDAEQETIVYGRYQVADKVMITEPFTNPDYGYKVPMYFLNEI